MKRLCEAKDKEMVMHCGLLFRVVRKYDCIQMVRLKTSEATGNLVLAKSHGKMSFGLHCKMWVNSYKPPETIKEMEVMRLRPAADYSNTGFISLSKKLAE